MCSSLTQNKYLTFQGLLVLVAGDKHLPHEGLAVASYIPDASVVRWHRTPTQHLQLTFLCELNESSFALLMVYPVQVKYPRGITTQGWEFHVLLFPKFLGIERMRYCSQHSGAITGVIVARACATMVHAHGQLLGIPYDLVGSPAVNCHDETNTARVSLVNWVV
jgi:hypothetical protein